MLILSKAEICRVKRQAVKLDAGSSFAIVFSGAGEAAVPVEGEILKKAGNRPKRAI